MECYLICNNNTHSPICLPDREAVSIGRTPETKITEARCSRKQVELRADYGLRQVSVKQIGSNSSAIDKTDLIQGRSLKLKEGSTLYILSGMFPHHIKFSSSGNDEEHGKKRKLSDDVPGGTNSKPKTARSSKSEGHELPLSDRVNGEKSDDVDVIKRKLEMMKKSKQESRKSETEMVGRDSKSEKDVNAGSGLQDQRLPRTSFACKSGWTQAEKLCVYVSDGVVASNKLGVSRGKTNITDLKGKFEKIVKEIQVPVQIFVSTGTGQYRKPARGMWSHLVEYGNDGMAVNLAESFFVGDAAGRKDKWAPGKKKDYACSDRLFALNVGVRFYTPDEYFLKSAPASYTMPEFDPRNTCPHLELLEPASARIPADKTEVIVLVGFPASGKSMFVREHLVPKGYVNISRDNLGSWQKCVSACTDAICSGTSAVIDNTNPDVESRKRYIGASTKMGVACRCFWLVTTHAQARHNERFREMTDKSHQPINDMVINSYKSKFVEPKLSEGFSEIVRVNFVPTFKDPEMKRLYQQFLLDK